MKCTYYSLAEASQLERHKQLMSARSAADGHALYTTIDCLCIRTDAQMDGRTSTTAIINVRIIWDHRAITAAIHHYTIAERCAARRSWYIIQIQLLRRRQWTRNRIRRRRMGPAVLHSKHVKYTETQQSVASKSEKKSHIVICILYY